MKISQNKIIRLHENVLSRTEAKKLINLCESHSEFKNIVCDLKSQLNDVYEYSCNCIGCGLRTNWKSSYELSKTELKEVKEDFLCERCLATDDFK